MKVRSVTISSAAAATAMLSAPSCPLTTAWTTSSPFPATAPRYLSSSASSSGRQSRRFMSAVVPSVGESADPSARRAAAATAAATEVATTTTVSEGNIVARFSGGLTAVRLTDGDALLLGSLPLNVAVAAAKSTVGAAITSYDLQGRRVSFPDGTSGLVVAHRPPVVFVLGQPEDQEASPSSTSTDGLAQVHSDLVKVSVSPNQRVVDFFGKPLDDSESTVMSDASQAMSRSIFAPIPQVKDIALINKPMLTGVTMMDSLAPIGKGQNMLMIGHDLAVMRGYAMDCLQTQVRDGGANVKIIYATTENEAEALHKLKERGIDKNVHVIAPTRQEKDDASRAAEAVAIASSACSVAEMYALEQGVDALVVIDTIDLHKQLWDVTTRVLVDVFGVDAVVEADRTGGASSEMRVFFSSLVQRSAQYKENRGGGSVTLLLLSSIPSENTLGDSVYSEKDFDKSPEKVKQRIQLLTGRKIPLTAANLRKVDIPVPSDGKRLLTLQHVDDLISMSDGQIWLDERLESQGQWPPMNPQRSVTRIGIGADTDSRADAAALRRIDGRFRLDLAQAFNMVGADETDATKRQIQRKDALLLAMHQMPGAGSRRLSESCVLLLAATTGKLDAVVAAGAVPGSEQGQHVIQSLLDHVFLTAPDAMAGIDQTLDMTDDVKEHILAALESYSY